MLSVAEALRVVLIHARPAAPRRHTLGPDSLGLVTAEDIDSDLDAPAFDKALMDGYAIRAGDAGNELDVVEEVVAGRLPLREVGPGQASRIMTGAALPAGADCVLPVEVSHEPRAGRVAFAQAKARPGLHVQPRASELQRGQLVLPAGSILRPQELGLLAAVGRVEVAVRPRPVVAVVPTGDELTDGPELPGPGRIRNSNGPMLAGQVARAGGSPIAFAPARDAHQSLRDTLAAALDRADVVALSGGVSMGKLDLVPGVLRELGVTVQFHKVHLKPGKPLLFGTLGDKLVFGLPGNPGSSFVGFELFARPALRRLLGYANPEPQFVPVPLAGDWRTRGDRPTYHPARFEVTATGWRVRPSAWFGSPDLRGLSTADALVLAAPGDNQYADGEAVPTLRLAED